MPASAVHHDFITPSASSASVVAALLVFDCDRDRPYVAIPRPEVQLVVRFGPSTRDSVDIHAFGARQSAHRKLIRVEQRTVTARLRLGAPQAVLGLAGRPPTNSSSWPPPTG